MMPFVRIITKGQFLTAKVNFSNFFLIDNSSAIKHIGYEVLPVFEESNPI